MVVRPGIEGNGSQDMAPVPRKVMLVADSSRESAAALQYALSHKIKDQDELILLHVESSAPSHSWQKPFLVSTLFRRHSSHYKKNRPLQEKSHIFHSQHRRNRRVHDSHNSSTVHAGEAAPVHVGEDGEMDFLEDMKSLCDVRHPNVRVRIIKVENKEKNDKASVIVQQSEMLGVESLIIGQRRIPGLLGLKKSATGSSSTRSSDTAEYLIEQSKCECIGVQKKGLNEGYLLNTKTRRNFWLLA